ncbi:MAG: 16S rRNA (uracil(1498)-N(3))-methyltransferase [Pseudomonadota bacterium]|nr:16S rRNA (uracil(1498)-N(3))-methyltransferase [Pseudomonadota bacterium]
MIATPAWPPRSLQRLLVAPPLGPEISVAVEGPQAHYLANVMRMDPGSQLLLFDGLSGEWLCEVVDVSKKRVVLIVRQQTRVQEVAPDLALAFAPIKKGRVDWLVEKAVELGVSRLQPVITRRTIVDRLNLDRMRSHIVEALEQCGRTSLAAIEDPVKLDVFLQGVDRDRVLYFADETGGAPARSAFEPGPATILIRPEGGFTTEEAQSIRAASGAIGISLGPRILRAETAALAAVAAWMTAVGDWDRAPRG